tara:strand:+ start:169 stop:768 length:600 start_codon:yes stop_codon:yes gene_type:complete
MKNRYCPNCESNKSVVEKKISIPVGNVSFSTKTLVCKECKHYELTPKIIKEMDEWGRGLTKNIVEPQPIFNEATHQFAEEMAKQYGLKRVPFFRLLTVYYLNHVVNRKDFHEIKKFCDEHSAKELFEGSRSKVSVPIRYLLFRKLQTFSEVWEVTHAKAIEEAVLFGLTVLSAEKNNFDTLKQIAENLQQYIADVAQAA